VAGVRQRAGAVRAQAVEDEGEIPPPQAGRGVGHVTGDIAGRAHQQDDVAAGDVSAHRAVLPSPADQGVNRREHPRAGTGNGRAELAGLLQERQVALLLLLRGDGEELQQRLPRVSRLQQPLAGRVQSVHPVQDDRGDEVVLRGEMTEHGALADAGPPRDVSDRGVQAPLRELLRRRPQQRLPVAGRVRAQGTGRGHSTTLPS